MPHGDVENDVVVEKGEEWCSAVTGAEPSDPRRVSDKASATMLSCMEVSVDLGR